MNAGWFARPCSITGAPGIHCDGPPSTAWELASKGHSDCDEGVAGVKVAPAAKVADGCNGNGAAAVAEERGAIARVGEVQSAGDKTVVDDSRPNVAPGTTFVEDSGTPLEGGTIVALDSCTNDPCANMAGGKMVVEDSGAIIVGDKTAALESRTNVTGGKTVVDGCDGASVAGGKTVVKGCCNVAGGKTVVAATCGAVMGEGVH